MYKEKVLNTNVYIFSFVLAIYFFLYPNVLFNYGILKILIKYPFLGLVFLITIYSAMKKRFTIKIEHFIFLIFIMISLKYSSENFLELSYMWLLSIFFYSLLSQKLYLNIFFRLYVIMAVLYAVHALFQYIVINLGISSLFSLSQGIGVTTHPFNVILGVIDSTNPKLFRPSSYFTESNRLAYFIIPAFFFINYSNLKYKIPIFFLLAIVLILTKSFAAFLAVSFFSTLYIKKIRLTSGVVFLSFLSITTYQVISGQIDFVSLDRVSSIATRLASLYHLQVTIFEFPFGITYADSYVFNIAPSFTGLIYWSIIGGFPALFLYLTVHIILLLRLHKYAKRSVSKYKNAYIGIICYITFEIFMGISFSFLFSIFIALTFVLISNEKESLKDPRRLE